jgi:hypothetical protein
MPHPAQPRSHGPSSSRGPTIQEGTTCRRCSYSLAGLTPDGVCPECGLPIMRSVGPWRASAEAPLYAVPRWRMCLLTIGLGAMGLAGTLTFLRMIFGLLPSAVWLGALVLAWAAGLLLVAIPRPLYVAMPAPDKARISPFRWVCIGAGLLCGGMAVLTALLPLASVREDWCMLAAGLTQWAWVIGSCLGAFLVLPTLSWLSDTALVDRLRDAAVLALAFGAMTLACRLILGIAPEWMHGIAWVVGVLSAMVFGVSSAYVNVAMLLAAWTTLWALANTRELQRIETKRMLRERERLAKAERKAAEAAAKARLDGQSPQRAQPSVQVTGPTLSLADDEDESDAVESAQPARYSVAGVRLTPQRISRSEHQIRPSGEVLEPYQLEDVEPEGA